MALADFPHCSEVIYEEECALGGNFKCAYFDKNSRTLFLISECDVVSFDPRNGTRKDVYHHDGKVIGLSFDGDLMSIYTREPPQVVLWHLETKDKVLCKETRIPVGYQPLYFYEVSGKHYLCVVDIKTAGNGQEEEAFLFQVCFDKSHPANKWQNVKTKQICSIGKRPATEKCLAVGNGFYVKCEGKTVKLVEFAKDGASESDEDDDEDSLEEAKKRQFTLESHFNVSRPDLVAFTEISISGDCLYATVNVGRVYVWSRFRELGIGPRNCSQLTLTGHQTTVSISNHGSMFVATGNGILFKYNAEGASGVGRWHRLSHLQLDSPPFALALSADSTMLAIIFVDNSVCTVQTAEMKLVASMETLNIAQTRESDYCFDILNDPADTGLLVQNARLGHIQWVDPFRWKTTNKMDVAEEHLPHQDTFNRPNFLWLNPYLAHLTLLRVVTCECRRNEPQTTFLKFWRRATAVSDQSIEPKLEDCFSLSGRISFIRSTLDGSQNVDQISAEKEEFLLVYSTGDLVVYQRDPERSGRWRLDTTRRMLNWQRSRVRSCSTIRGDLFAAVNSLGESTSAVVVWKLEEMEVVRILEELASPNQAEWAPQPNVLLISCASGLVAFDNSSGNFLWAIIQSDITAISSTSIATFAHNGQDVFVIDAESGLLKEEGQLRFSRQQKRIIALERQGNVCFAGMDSEGSLSLTTPIISIAEEPPKQAEEIKEEVKEKRKKTKHKTAFSQLLKNGEQGQQNGGGEEKEENGHGSAEDVEMRNSSPPPSQPLMNKVSLRKLLDGPAYSLPHISQLAEQYVQSCLTKRHK